MNYKFCVKCGHKISANAMFCPHCGTQQPSNNQTNQGYNQKPNSNIDNDFNPNGMNNNYQSQQPNYNNYQPYNQVPPSANQYNNSQTRIKPFEVVWHKYWNNVWNYNGCTSRSDFNRIIIMLIIVWILVLVIAGGSGIAIARIVVYALGGDIAIRRAHDAGMSTGCATVLLILFGLLFEIAMMFPGSHSYSNVQFKRRAVRKGYPPVV